MNPFIFSNVPQIHQPNPFLISFSANLMANNQQPARPWFRVASLSRPAPPQPQSPAPPPPPQEVTVAPSQPRPFRNISQPNPVTRPATDGPRPSPSTTPAMQPTQLPPATPVLQPTQPPPRSASVPPTPVVRTTGIAAASSSASVPSSPTNRVISSVPSTPLTKSVPPPPPTTVSSVPASPILAPAAGPTSSVVNSPVRSNPVSGTKSVPNSPQFAARNLPAIRTATAAVVETPQPLSPKTKSTAPPPSPRDVKTPPQSPKMKSIVRPPSPLVLPPTQFKPEFNSPPEAEQKTVMVQNKVEKNHSTTHKLWSVGTSETGKNNPSKSDTNKGTKIITIAGENKGATMELFRTPRKSTSSLFPGKPNYLNGNSEASSGSSSGEEDSDEKNQRGGGDGRRKKPMSAIMNSNVQGITNSIMFNSTCSHHDPGVHLALSRKPVGGGGGMSGGRHSNGYQS